MRFFDLNTFRIWWEAPLSITSRRRLSLGRIGILRIFLGEDAIWPKNDIYHEVAERVGGGVRVIGR